MVAPEPVIIPSPLPGAPEGSDDALVDFEALDMFGRALPEGLGGGFLSLALAATMLQTLAAPRLLVPWVAAVAGVLSVGLMLALRYRRHPPGLRDTAKWRLRFLLLLTSAGLAWGAAGWLFVPAPWQAEVVVVTLLSLMSVGILAHTGANLALFIAYVTAALLPSVLHRMLLGGMLNLTVAAATLLTMLGLIMFATRISIATRRSLRVGHENRRLARALAERTREAEQASLDKSRFIAAASHDLRQPVHALGLLLDVLQGQNLPCEASSTVVRMERVLDSLNALFDGLLDISKLDCGAIEPRRVDFALAPLLERMADTFMSEAHAKGLSLRCRVSAAYVNSDPFLLERMLSNLLANAIRYTTDGGILIGCRRRGEVARIEVWDSGIGIEAEQQAAIFHEFYQVANPQRGRGKGLGLGLAITRRLGALLQHRIELRSRPGRGSVFRLDLPIAPRPDMEENIATATDSLVDLPTIWAGRSVLVVDDDAPARDALSRWLSGWGCRVTAYESAEVVHASLVTTFAAPDALITDWHLLGSENGLNVAQMVRNRSDPKLPAILITGQTRDDVQRLAQEHRVVLLYKPVRPAALRAALAALWQTDRIASDALL